MTLKTFMLLLCVAGASFCFLQGWRLNRRGTSDVLATAHRVDLGEVFVNQRHVFEVDIKNPEKEKIRLGLPRSSCGCTDVKLERSMLGSGEVARLTGSFLSASIGPRTSYVRIPYVLNETAHEFAIELIVDATSPLLCPRCAQVADTTSGEHSIKVTNRSRDVIVVRQHASDPTGLIESRQDQLVLPAGKDGWWRVAFPRGILNQTTAQIDLRVETDILDFHIISCNLVFNEGHGVRVVPDRLTLWSQDTDTHYLSLNASSRGFVVESVDAAQFDLSPRDLVGSALPSRIGVSSSELRSGEILINVRDADGDRGVVQIPVAVVE